MSHEPRASRRCYYCYFCYYFRNSGNLYGGTLNITRMGFYSTNDKLLHTTFKETTIVRRLNVHGIHLRTMFVVCNMMRLCKRFTLEHNRIQRTLHHIRSHSMESIYQIWPFSFIFSRFQQNGIGSFGVLEF